MKIQETREGEVRVLTPDGPLSGTHACAALDNKLGSVTGQGARFVVLDLGEVEQIGGPALRTLVLAARTLRRKKGRLVVCRLTQPLHRIFSASGFERDVAVVGTVREAVRWVAEASIGASRRVSTPARAAFETDRAVTLADLVSRVVGADAPPSAISFSPLSAEQCAAAAPDAFAALVLDLVSASPVRPPA